MLDHARLGFAATLVAVALVGCAPQDDPSSTEPAAAFADLPIPVPGGEVTVAGAVLDDGDGPELCAALLESYPPQGGGPSIEGWDWDAVPHDEASGVRWTESVELQGTFDGTTFTMTEAPVSPSSDVPAPTMPPGAADQAAIDAMLADLESHERPDVLSWSEGDGVVLLEVLYDDGSLQAGLDDLYGDDVVVVDSWMQDV